MKNLENWESLKEHAYLYQKKKKDGWRKLAGPGQDKPRQMQPQLNHVIICIYCALK